MYNRTRAHRSVTYIGLRDLIFALGVNAPARSSRPRPRESAPGPFLALDARLRKRGDADIFRNAPDTITILPLPSLVI